jgi:hypothetical protein
MLFQLQKLGLPKVKCDGTTIMNKEMHLSEQTEENQEWTFRTADNPTECQTRHVPNSDTEQYRCAGRCELVTPVPYHKDLNERKQHRRWVPPATSGGTGRRQEVCCCCCWLRPLRENSRRYVRVGGMLSHTTGMGMATKKEDCLPHRNRTSAVQSISRLLWKPG